jgi:hypothetical protein
MNTAPVSWVVYSRPVHRQDPMLAVCEQSEWDKIELGRPGVNTLIKCGFTSEGAAEQAARPVFAPTLRPKWKWQG